MNFFSYTFSTGPTLDSLYLKGSVEDAFNLETEEYLSRARILQEQDAQLERPQWLTGAIARLADYERRASMENQLQTAIRAVEMQAKLLRFDMSA